MTTRRLGALSLALLLAVGACGTEDDPIVAQPTAPAPVTAEASAEATAVPTPDPEPADAPADGLAGSVDPVDPEAVDPTAEDAEGRLEVLEVEQGGATVALDGTLGAEADVFIVPIPTCCTGETFGVLVSSPDGAVVAEVVDPAGETFVSDQTDVQIEPDEVGDWTIILTGPPDSSYVLEVGLGVDAS